MSIDAASRARRAGYLYTPNGESRDTCAAKAVGSDGKKMSGAAKTSCMKKCEAGA